MDKKQTGSDWAKGGIITLSKSANTENTYNKENTDNKVNTVNTVNTENTTNTEKKEITEKKNSVKEKMHRLTMDITEEDFKKLRIMAAMHGKTIAAYFRDVVINGEKK